MESDRGESFADLLPPLATEELAALKADIGEHGVLCPIFVDENGKILDGRHRHAIDPKAPRKVIKGLSPAEKQAFVFRTNFVRRNLSPDQKHVALRKMKGVAFALRKEDAKKNTQAQVAKLLGVAQPTVASWFSDTSSISSDNACNPRPDARVKVNPKVKPVIADRVAAGESQTQVAADYGVSQQTVSGIVAAETAKQQKGADRAKAAAMAEATIKGDDCGVKIGDFREVAETLESGSVDLIFTDPPYDRDSLDLFEALGIVAARVLCDGGSLVTYFPQYLLPEVMGGLGQQLRYWWTLAVVHSGARTRMREYGIIVGWKPLAWFVKGTRGDKQTWIDDVVVSAQEKDAHDWQQSVIEARHCIARLCPAGGLVWDPFCGGGTTAVAAKQTGRLWLTCDTDDAAVHLARKRIHDAAVAAVAEERTDAADGSQEC